MITPKFWHRGKRDEKAVDSCYGTNSEVTDMEISWFFLSHVIAHPPVTSSFPHHQFLLNR